MSGCSRDRTSQIRQGYNNDTTKWPRHADKETSCRPWTPSDSTPAKEADYVTDGLLAPLKEPVKWCSERLQPPLRPLQKGTNFVMVGTGLCVFLCSPFGQASQGEIIRGLQ